MLAQSTTGANQQTTAFAKTAILTKSKVAGFKAVMTGAVDVEVVEAEVGEAIVMIDILAAFKSMSTSMSTQFLL